ncbi:MAG: hypothetical protein ACRENL_11445 [Candidatus Dormibacteria bacterium]
MTAFRVQPNCYGVHTRDGSYYPAKGSHVEITEPRHVREIETSMTLDVGYIERARTIFSDAEGITCDCGFTAFAWQAGSACPRCGEPLKETQ